MTKDKLKPLTLAARRFENLFPEGHMECTQQDLKSPDFQMAPAESVTQLTGAGRLPCESKLMGLSEETPKRR